MWQGPVKNAALQHNPQLIMPESEYGYSILNKPVKNAGFVNFAQPTETGVAWVHVNP